MSSGPLLYMDGSFRQLLLTSHSFYVEQARKRLLSHFGDIEDLRTDNTTNKNNDQLGYTNAAVELHTDQPFIADPPHFQ